MTFRSRGPIRRRRPNCIIETATPRTKQINFNNTMSQIALTDNGATIPWTHASIITDAKKALTQYIEKGFQQNYQVPVRLYEITKSGVRVPNTFITSNQSIVYRDDRTVPYKFHAPYETDYSRAQEFPRRPVGGSYQYVLRERRTCHVLPRGENRHEWGYCRWSDTNVCFEVRKNPDVLRNADHRRSAPNRRDAVQTGRYRVYDKPACPDRTHRNARTEGRVGHCQDHGAVHRGVRFTP